MTNAHEEEKEVFSKEVHLPSVNLGTFSRKCIGWKLDRNIDTRLPLNALHQALG